MTVKSRIGWVALAVFVATIPLANWTTDTYGFRDVWWVGMIPAGTVWISVAFVARDMTQLTLGKVWALVGIAAGGVLSLVLADPGLAWASFAAFTVSELLDMGIYTPLADRGKFVLAVLLSSVVGGSLDSWLFLRIAFGEAAAADGWWRLAIAKAVIILLVTPSRLCVVVLYLATSPCEPEVADLLSRRRLGLMCQPASNAPQAGWLWAADNGCFSPGWDEGRWETWLERDMPRSGCLFAVVPDVVGDAFATLDRFDEYVGTVRDARYPVAFVAQDGLLPGDAPYKDFDCLFIGGSTDWKLSETAHALAREARALGKWVHLGRCNSGSRYKAWAADADTCDGTYLAFGPKTNLPRLMSWVDGHDLNPQLALTYED